MNSFRIIIGETPQKCAVELNGKPLDMVKSARLTLRPKELPTLELNVYGVGEVAGRLEDVRLVLIDATVDNDMEAPRHLVEPIAKGGAA